MGLGWCGLVLRTTSKTLWAFSGRRSRTVVRIGPEDSVAGHAVERLARQGSLECGIRFLKPPSSLQGHAPAGLDGRTVLSQVDGSAKVVQSPGVLSELEEGQAAIDVGRSEARIAPQGLGVVLDGLCLLARHGQEASRLK